MVNVWHGGDGPAPSVRGKVSVMTDARKEIAEIMAHLAPSPGGVQHHGIGDAVRPVFYMTEHEEFLYATDGGTLFLVRFEGRIYAITARHVFTGNGFEPNRLFVTREKYAKKGTPPAPVAGIYYPSAPHGAAAGTDIGDLCVIEFDEGMEDDFFMSSPYDMDKLPVGTSEAGHSLAVYGVLKEKTTIIHADQGGGDIVIGYCQLEYADTTTTTRDAVLREAKAEFLAPAFSSVTGISGSPVYDKTTGALCGMVVRGGMNGARSDIRFIDMFDIKKFLEGVSSGATGTNYEKIVPEYRE
jgi:hypothetical protein